VPVRFSILSVRGEKNGAKADTHLKRSPLTRVKRSTAILVSTYIDVASAPDAATVIYAYTGSKTKRSVLRWTEAGRLGSPAAGRYRNHITFRGSKTGTYVFTATVRIGDEVHTKSTRIKVTK